MCDLAGEFFCANGSSRQQKELQLKSWHCSFDTDETHNPYENMKEKGEIAKVRRRERWNKAPGRSRTDDHSITQYHQLASPCPQEPRPFGMSFPFPKQRLNLLVGVEQDGVIRGGSCQSWPVGSCTPARMKTQGLGFHALWGWIPKWHKGSITLFLVEEIIWNISAGFNIWY